MKSKKLSKEDEYYYLYGDLSEAPNWFQNHEDSFISNYDIDSDLIYQGSEISSQIYNIASFFSFFINLFHLLVLTRKELRSNLVYIILIGICVCDLFQSLGNITQIIMMWNIVYKIEPCFGALKYSHLMVDTVAKTWQIMSRRCSGLLALYVAMFRALSVIYPMSNLVEVMMRPRSGIWVILCGGVASGGWSLVYFVKTKFKKVTFCGGDYSGFEGQMFMPSYVPYEPISDRAWEKLYFMVDGAMALFVSVTYVIVAIALSLAVWKANRKMKKLKNEKSTGSTTALVIVMALTFFFSETAYGLLFLFNYTFFRNFNDGSQFRQFETFPLTLQILNSSIHCFLCFCMSAQYRSTVKGLFLLGKKKGKSIVSVQGTRSSGDSSTISVFLKRSY